MSKLHKRRLAALDEAKEVRRRIAAKGQTFDTVKEVRRSREERTARLSTNYLDADGNVVVGVKTLEGVPDE